MILYLIVSMSEFLIRSQINKRKKQGETMKNRLIHITSFILLFCILCSMISLASAATSPFVLMIYMCGSNLESEAGMASLDIQEMIDSCVNDTIKIIVMTGGSHHWDRQGISADAVQIHQVDNSGIRLLATLPSSDGVPQNMGSSTTLTKMIDYTVEQYPIGQYALVLWDHGGGPLKGVCSDEWHKMDNLKLNEISDGISKSKLPRKFSWIGFDACLMGSLEVACAIEPYADYLIASQSTEIGTGWDYSFLSEINPEDDGRVIGEKIVNAYCKSYVSKQDILTMSCIDLNKLSLLIGEMDAFFQPISEMLTDAQFPDLYRKCINTISFGRAESSQESGLDLLDLGSLISRLEDYPGRGDGLREAIKNVVICNQSNMDGLCGLNVYHPLQNSIDYKAHWKKDYRWFGCGEGYMRYMETFGDLLISADTTDWSNLMTIAVPEAGEQTVTHFSLQLTEEQARSFGSGRLLILNQERNSWSGEENGYSIVAVSKATLDENNMLHAKYDGKMLYADNGIGEIIGPISPFIRKDGRLGVSALGFPVRTSWAQDEMTNAIIYVINNESGVNQPVIDKTLIYDETSNIYSSRLPYEEKRYSSLEFWADCRLLPDLRGTIPAFDDWKSADYFKNKDMNLPADWHFCLTNEMYAGENQLAMFEITDIHEYVYGSRPVELNTTGQTAITVDSPFMGNEDVLFELSGEVVNLTNKKEILFHYSITNRTAEETEYYLWSPIINKTKRVYEDDRHAVVAYVNVEPYSTKTVTVVVDSKYLTDIDEITEITVEVQAGWTAIFDRKELTYSIQGCDVRAIQPVETALAGTDVNGISWQLRGIQQDANGNILLSMHIKNNQGEENVGVFDPYFAASKVDINGVQLDGNYFGQKIKVDQGENQDFEILLTNTETFSNWEVDGEWGYDEPGVSGSIAITDRILQRHGIKTISQLKMFYNDRDNIIPIELNLKKPWIIPDNSGYRQTDIWFGSLPEIGATDGVVFPVIGETEQYTLRLERLFIGKKGLAACMEVENKTDNILYLKATPFVINNQGVYTSADCEVLPRCKAVWTLITGAAVDLGTEIESLNFGLVASVTGNFWNLKIPKQIITIQLPGKQITGQTNGKGIEADKCRCNFAMDVVPESTDLIDYETKYICNTIQKEGQETKPLREERYIVFHADGTAEYKLDDYLKEEGKWGIIRRSIFLYNNQYVAFDRKGDTLIVRHNDEYMHFEPAPVFTESPVIETPTVNSYEEMLQKNDTVHETQLPWNRVMLVGLGIALIIIIRRNRRNKGN